MFVRERDASGKWFDGRERRERGERDYPRVAVMTINRGKLKELQTREAKRFIAEQSAVGGALFAG